MAAETRVCIYNTDPGFARALRDKLANIANVKVITEAGDRATLLDVLRRLAVDVLIAHLDPHPHAALETIDAISTMAPDLGIVGLSEDKSPDMIIAAMRAGCRQFVAKPLEPNDLAEALARVSITRMQGAETGKRIAVIGASGGAGTTNIACNLAIELARIAGAMTGLIDLHLEFGDICVNFDCQARNTISDLSAAGTEIDEELVQAAMTELPCNVAILGRPNMVEEAASVAPEHIGRIVHMLSTLYPAVVMDTPRCFDRMVLSTLEQADDILLVLQLNVPSIRNAIRCHTTLLSYGMPKERIHLVVNRYRKSHGAISPADVESQTNEKIFALIPNDYQVVTAALNFGHTLVADAPDSPVQKAISTMAHELLGLSENDAGAKGARPSGLFGRLFGAPSERS